jgi:hypothetical protein
VARFSAKDCASPLILQPLPDFTLALAVQRAGYPGFVRDRVVALSQQEASHVSFLETGLTAAGVTPTKACKCASHPHQPALDSRGSRSCADNFPYKTVDEFLALSRVLEGVGVSAYLGAAGDISLDAYVTAAGAILTVEARHQAVISEVRTRLLSLPTAR